jgi:glycosyltransferase involved in cell wall biosynthesis
MEKNKIGIGIVTYNSENYFKDLWNSIQSSCVRFDELVVVNGGNKYEGNYECGWIQHNINYYPAVCRNDAINFLMNRGCEHIFLIEDDMIIKSPEIFNKYIQASTASGLKYFSFCSTSWNSGEPGKRTPRLTIEYKPDVSVSFYKNMCNEFTYHHYTAFKNTGLYDTQFRDPFDIDMAYRESQQGHAAPFWWFADVTGSDNLIENNPVAVSRLQGERPDGSRAQRIEEQWKLFVNKHGKMVNQIPDLTREQALQSLITKRKKYTK